MCTAIAAPQIGRANQSLNADHLQTIETARSLLGYGVENRDPVALIQAVRMFNSVGLVEGKQAKRVGGTVTSSEDSKTKTMSDVLANSNHNLLHLAAEYAGDNPELLAMIADAEAEQSRGAGGLVYLETVAAGATQDFVVEFDPSETAAIYVESDFGSAMMVSVNDASGNKVCGTPMATEYFRCEWMAGDAGSYTVQIQNADAKPQEYVFLTN